MSISTTSAWRSRVVVALVAAGCGDDAVVTPPDQPDAGPSLVWNDEFAGPAGQSPDPSKWVFDVGGHGWGNRQLEYDTARPENASLDGLGHLRITARAEPYLGSSYTSARLKTQGLFAQAYGRFEARILLPRGRGLWPAFWLLGSDIDSVSWPACGEIDVMEYRGQETGIIHGSVHGPGYSGGDAETATHALGGGARYDADFHVFAVDWQPERIDFSVDGTVYQRITPAKLPAGAPWVFDHPFFILLNVAVGGDFVGPPDESTVFPQEMVVDYVRVYGR
jgi:beta-glucanase (GH16 family)